jgi:chromosome segregation ATPase
MSLQAARARVARLRKTVEPIMELDKALEELGSLERAGSDLRTAVDSAKAELDKLRADVDSAKAGIIKAKDESDNLISHAKAIAEEIQAQAAIDAHSVVEKAEADAQAVRTEADVYAAGVKEDTEALQSHRDDMIKQAADAEKRLAVAREAIAKLMAS